MTLAHIHLLLNHFPTIGTAMGLGLLVLSLVRNNTDLKRASLGILFVIALLALPAYLSGNAAQAEIKGQPGVSDELIESHQDAALPGFILMELTGLIAWFGLWQFRRMSHPAGWNLPIVLLLSVLTFGLMTRTALIGGEIRHPEIRSVQDASASDGHLAGEPRWLRSASIASFVVGHPWVWPASETLHFIGLCLLFGIVLLANMRLLGAMKKLSFADVHELLPWGVLGFSVNAVTGMLFFIAAPEQYTQNVAFYWKIALILLAGVNALYLTVLDEAWALGAGEDASLTLKVVAATAIVVWVGVIYCGRMLPFIGNSF